MEIGPKYKNQKCIFAFNLLLSVLNPTLSQFASKQVYICAKIRCLAKYSLLDIWISCLALGS